MTVLHRDGELRTETAIDAVDRQLIDLLRANGRASYAELARQVGLSSPAVHERVGKLEAAGVITGYRAVVDPPSVGLDVTALVGVIESDSVDDTGLETAMREVPGIEDCWRVAGSEGYVLKVRVTDIPALEATVNALNRIRGVARTRTHGRPVDQVGGPSWLRAVPPDEPGGRAGDAAAGPALAADVHGRAAGHRSPCSPLVLWMAGLDFCSGLLFGLLLSMPVVLPRSCGPRGSGSPRRWPPAASPGGQPRRTSAPGSSGHRVACSRSARARRRAARRSPG